VSKIFRVGRQRIIRCASKIVSLQVATPELPNIGSICHCPKVGLTLKGTIPANDNVKTVQYR
jgi:hypothetical protein